MNRHPLRVAVPWSLSHYIPLNGFHTLYRALFDQAPAGIELYAWDNVKLHNRFKRDLEIRTAVNKAAKHCTGKLRKFRIGSITRAYEEFFWPPNQILTNELVGDIEFHHTAPFPSLKRPFVFHCESFAPVFLPFAQQGSGKFENHEELRGHYHRIFSNQLCLGIFSHIPETLESLSRFFSDTDIDRKLFSSRIGLSSKSFTESEPTEKNSLSMPRFLFINSAHQNVKNFFNRGGHIVLRFWKAFKASGRDGILILRCAKPSKQDLIYYGVDTSFLDAETSNSIIWAEDYLANHEINALMTNAHFFLLPCRSLHSASIMQAMTLGTIPVVTDTVGTSTYITDEEHGIVLQGVREGIWHTDPTTGVLIDRYHRTPKLDDSLVFQLTNRIIAMLDAPDAYDKIRNSAMAHAQQFSGEAFSANFWGSVAKIYQDHKQRSSHTNPLPGEIGQSLKDCTLQEDDWPRVFESVTQPMRRIYTGQSIVWELGGAFLHSFGNPSMELNDWSVFAQYYSIDAPKITFTKIIVELGGKFLSFVDGQGKTSPHELISFISKMLMPFPEVHSFAANSLKKIRLYNKYFRRYRQFLSIKFSKSNTAPDVELVLHDVSGYNIIRYFHKYYAILQSEGSFIQEKAESGGYSSSFSGFSINRVLGKIVSATSKANQLAVNNGGNSKPELALEGFNGYNIIRLGEKFHAILQSDGVFEYSKLLSGQYNCFFSGQSLNEVKELVLASIDSVPNKSKAV